MFDPDVSIDNEDDDVLNRNKFAKKLANSIEEYEEPQTLTIGLNGSWGSGKTSLINLTINQINQENYLVIKFNPWFFSNQNNLYLQFFKLIINELKDAQDNSGNTIGRKLTHIKTMFQKSASETLQNYYDYIKSNSSVNLSVNNVGLSVSENEESFESLQFHKYQCDTYFEQLDFKLLIIIDDIDRLIDDEIKQVFTLVKSLANFPNVIYLLAFDKNVVAKSLDRIHSDYADKFLDKIIQIPITIPHISESKLNELILTNIEPIYNEYLNRNFENDANEFRQVSEYLNIFIRDIRDLKRYVNILNFYLDDFVDELNITDFFLILAIQIFEYKIYLKIKEFKDILTYSDNLFFDSEDMFEFEVNKIVGDFEKSVEHTNSSDLMKLLEFLFPILRINYAVGQNASEYVDSFENRRLRSDKHFEKYFTLSLESNEVSAILLGRLIQLDDVDGISEIFTHESDLDYNHSLLTQFMKLLPKIPNENAEFFIRALMKCGDEMNLYSVSRRPLEWILDELFVMINDRHKCFEILKDCVGYENNVFTVSEFIYALSFEYGLAGDNKKIKSEKEMPVDKWQVIELKELTVKKIRKCSENKDLLKQTFLQSMLTYWELLDSKSIVRKYVIDNVESDEEILSFLSKFRTIQHTKMSLKGGTSKAEMRFDFEKLDTYHGLKFYKDKVIEILFSEGISDDVKRFCDLFIGQLREFEYKWDKYKRYPLFISHCWDYKDAYYTVENWIDESDIDWRNMSIPAHDPKDTRSDKELEQVIDNNIRNSSLFVIIAGMYVSQENRVWINKEIEIAQKYNKLILVIKPWANQRTPTKIQEVANKIVSWQNSSVISGIKELL